MELLAERIGITPATVSFHLKKPEEAGAVQSRKEQYYTVYSINREVFDVSIPDILSERSEESREQEEREVNLIIADYHDDFCSISRDMIAEHILSRENMIYRKA